MKKCTLLIVERIKLELFSKCKTLSIHSLVVKRRRQAHKVSDWRLRLIVSFSIFSVCMVIISK